MRAKTRILSQTPVLDYKELAQAILSEAIFFLRDEKNDSRFSSGVRGKNRLNYVDFFLCVYFPVAAAAAAASAHAHACSGRIYKRRWRRRQKRTAEERKRCTGENYSTSTISCSSGSYSRWTGS